MNNTQAKGMSIISLLVFPHAVASSTSGRYYTLPSFIFSDARSTPRFSRSCTVSYIVNPRQTVSTHVLRREVTGHDRVFRRRYKKRTIFASTHTHTSWQVTFGVCAWVVLWFVTIRRLNYGQLKVFTPSTVHNYFY